MYSSFHKDENAANLILSIGTCHAEKVATQMSKSCRPKWTVGTYGQP